MALAAIVLRSGAAAHARAPDIAHGRHIATVLAWLWAMLHSGDSERMRRLGRIAHDIGTAYDADQQTFNDWLITMIRTDPQRATTLGAIAFEPVPVSLARVGAYVSRTLLQSDLGPAHQAVLLQNLSVDLAASGDWAGALAASEQAVERYRRLAAAHPVFEPDLETD